MERFKMPLAEIIDQSKDKCLTQLEDLFISHAHSNNVCCCFDLGQATKNKVRKM
jgi:Holliday junction resolvase-like predicted endonuclease